MTAASFTPSDASPDTGPAATDAGGFVGIETTVNGRTVPAEVPPRLHLADFLRRQLGLTGTHLGCEQGACGMCTVMVDGEAVKACLMLACQVDGRDVRTVESLAEGEELSSLQQMFKEEHALQCGFCTPGFLMTVTALSQQGGTDPSRAEIRDEIAGVLCRCTGYENIVNAVERWFREHPARAADPDDAR